MAAREEATVAEEEGLGQVGEHDDVLAGSIPSSGMSYSRIIVERVYGSGEDGVHA